MLPKYIHWSQCPTTPTTTIPLNFKAMKRICVSLRTIPRTCGYNKTYIYTTKSVQINGKWVLCVRSTGARRSIRKSHQSEVGLVLPCHSFELTDEADGWEIVFLLWWHKRITDLPNYRPQRTDTTAFGSHSASAKICLYLLLWLLRIFFRRRFVSCCRHVALRALNGMAFVFATIWCWASLWTSAFLALLSLIIAD